MAGPLPLAPLVPLFLLLLAPPTWAEGGGASLEASMHSFLWDAQEGEWPSNRVTPTVYPEPLAVAVVGHVFQVALPSGSDDLHLGVKVLEVGLDTPPSWLHWDPETRTLQGLPLDQDKGLHDLCVTSADSSSRVFLSLEVQDEEQLLQEDQPFSCGPREPLTLLTVVLDADLTKMNSHQRVALLETMKSFSGTELRDMKVQPVVNNRLFDMSAFVAGPGNARKVVENGALLSWKLGCSLDQASVPDLGAVGGPARSGSMATVLGVPVVGWHVANRWPEATARRPRRQLGGSGPTPVLTAGPPPTSLVQPPVRVVPSPVPSSPAAAAPPTSTLAPPARGPAPPLPGRPTSRTRDPLGQTPTLAPPPPTSLSPPATSTIVPPIRPTATRPTYAEATPTPPGPTPTRKSTRKPKKPRTTTPGPLPPTTPPPPPDPSNSPPRLMNPVDEVAALVGTYFEVKVPLDTFFDREDGTADKLRLTLRRQGRNRDPVPPDSWIQVDPARQLIYGLPDPRHVGRHEFFLQAADRGGLTAVDALEVRVAAWPADDPGPALFWARLEEGEGAPDPRRPPLRDPRRKVALVRKLAAAMGDRNASNVSLRNISQGSVLVEWSNSSLHRGDRSGRRNGHCPREQLLALSALLSPDLQGAPSDNLRSALEPDYRPVEVRVRGLGPCQGFSFVPLRDLDIAPPPPGGAAATSPPHQRSSSGEQAYLHTVVPAAVVGAALLAGGLLALCCYRRRRRGRLSLEEQAAFVKKGVPIIFAHELDRAPPSSSSSATAPLVLPEEKPPLAPPPEYPATPPPPARATPPQFRRGEEDPDAPPYQPPPPFASAGPPPPEGGGGSRPKNMTPYRAPPPYVPP